MSVPSTRRPGAAIAIAALLIAGLAAPASASPWSDAWSRLAGWLAGTPFGALWAEDTTPAPGGDGETGQSTRIWQNDGAPIPPVGRPVDAESDQGVMVDPNGVPRP